MRTTAHIPVREHQRLVLLTLRGARKPLTPDQIADHLNSSRHKTGRPESSSIDIEASLAALMLRPDLAGLLTLHTRRATPIERQQRTRTRLGALGSLVILSACTTLPTPSGQPVAKMPSYFGNPVPTSKPAAIATRPLFAGAVFATAQRAYPAFSESDTEEYAGRTPVPETVAAISYFSDEATRDFPARAKTDIPAPQILAQSSPTLASTAVLTPATTVIASNSPPPTLRVLPPSVPSEKPWLIPPSLPTLTLSLASHTAPPRLFDLPDTTTGRSTRQNSVAAPLQPVIPPAETATAVKPTSVAHDKLDFADAPSPDVYDDIVTFANGSLVLSFHAQQRVLSLLRSAKVASSIQLRGRVGYRTLNTEMARQAVGRAVAVRQFLIANGVAKEKIRIHMPRDNDLVNDSTPSDEVNRSVSVFMKVDPSIASSIGLKHGQPISVSTKVSSAS